MFCRVGTTFDKPIFTTNGGLMTFTGVNQDGETKGVFYNKIWTPDEENYYKIIPKQHREHFYLNRMLINCEAPPHTDTGINTTINFYFQTNKERTVFYELTTDNPKKTQIENQTDGFFFDYDEIKEVGSFTAKDYEIWVLDVKKVHSVLGDVKERKAITLGTTLKYEDVVEMIKEAGYEVYTN